jgi:hypothetical protein
MYKFQRKRLSFNIAGALCMMLRMLPGICARICARMHAVHALPSELRLHQLDEAFKALKA